MNYSLDNLPYSGEFPCVFMEIVVKGVVIGQVSIRLFREAFPAGVENFVKIISGSTTRRQKKGFGNYIYTKNIKRTYQNCKFYDYSFDGFAMSGDIYSNNGSDAGTIYNDIPIPPLFGDYVYPHNAKGLISLVSYTDKNNKMFYDSTFSFSLKTPSKMVASQLDLNQVVIGQIYDGIELIDKINDMIVPFAGRSYPIFSIGECGVIRKGRSVRTRPYTDRKNS